MRVLKDRFIRYSRVALTTPCVGAHDEHPDDDCRRGRGRPPCLPTTNAPTMAMAWAGAHKGRPYLTPRRGRGRTPCLPAAGALATVIPGRAPTGGVPAVQFNARSCAQYRATPSR